MKGARQDKEYKEYKEYEEFKNPRFGGSSGRKVRLNVGLLELLVLLGLLLTKRMYRKRSQRRRQEPQA
jgi:hypothetical protein